MKASDFHAAADLVRLTNGDTIEILTGSSLIGALLRLDATPANARSGCIVRSEELGEFAPDACAQLLQEYRTMAFSG
jgi:hypothetical protein